MKWLIQAQGRFLVDFGISCRWVPDRKRATRFQSKYLAEAVIKREYAKWGALEMRSVPDLRVVGVRQGHAS